MTQKQKAIKKMNNVVIVGAGGNARKIIDIFNDTKINIIGLISSESKGSSIYGHKVIGTIKEINRLKKLYAIKSAIVSIGDNFRRKQIAHYIQRFGINLINAIHPSAEISESAIIGTGNIIVTGAILHAMTKVGNGCLIDTNAVIEHDCDIRDFSSVGPGAVLCGNVKVNTVTAIGAGATVLEKRSIGKHCVIGGGALVNRSIPDNSLAYGVPAKVIKKREKEEKYLL